jgi:hypothetical protein
VLVNGRESSSPLNSFRNPDESLPKTGVKSYITVYTHESCSHFAKNTIIKCISGFIQSHPHPRALYCQVAGVSARITPRRRPRALRLAVLTVSTLS